MRCACRILLICVSTALTCFLLWRYLKLKYSNDVREISTLPRQRNVITVVKTFPQSGDDVKFDQPWKIPEQKVIEEEKELLAMDSKFIVSNFSYSKGLGNLMWQMAALSAMAQRNDALVLLPSDSTLRRAFQPKCIQVTPTLNDILLKKFEGSAITFTDCCSYRNLTGLFGGNTKFQSIIGYMQNLKWFHPDHSELVREQFVFHPEIIELADKELQTAKAQKLVSQSVRQGSVQGDETFIIKDGYAYSDPLIVGVHIRRGMDVTSHSRNLQHGHLAAPKEYYLTAMNSLREKYDNIVFVICTDHVTWVKQNIKGMEGEIHISSGKYREVDMAVLGMTDHVIMSTGTYSFWAAYLADKPVTYYSGWPRKGSQLDMMINKEDYFLKEWHSMQ